MPDSWSVPIAPGVIPSNINDRIAQGPDLSWINNLANSYFQGKDQQYTQNQRDLFKQGLPKDPNGNIDWNQVSQKLAQTGGAGQIQNVIGLQDTQMMREALDKAGKTNIFSPLGGQDQQPQQSPLGPPSSATAITNTPNARMASAQPNASNDIPSGSPSPPGQNLVQPNETNYSVSRGPVETAGPNGFSAPPQMQQPQQGQPQQPQQQPFQTAQASGQPRMDETTAQMYDKRAADAAQYATVIAIKNPAAAAQLKSLSEQWAKQSQIIRGALAKNAETTPAQKDLVPMSGMPQGAAVQTKLVEGQIKTGQAEYSGIQAQSSQYEKDMKPYLELSKSILNRPEMYSGIGANYALDFNKVRAALGDQRAAVLQEALQKVTASSVLGQINQQRDQLQEAGGTSSRIFSQQVELVQKAAPQITNTVYGNRFLVNVASRMGEFSSEVARQARSYVKDHGYLDSGFDGQIANYVSNNPIFSKSELSDPRVLGAPQAPEVNSPQQAMQWANSMGLKSGDPFAIPGGKIKYVP
jgi:hypothetical protein